MGKKVKINGQWLTVKDEDVKDDFIEIDGDKFKVDPEDSSKPLKDDEGNNVPYEEVGAGGDGGGDGGGSDDDKSIIAQSQKLGKGIAKQVMKDLNMGDMSKLDKKLQNVIDLVIPNDSKLKQILNGKDYIRDAGDLTKEEKIVGFYHALVTDNKIALKSLSEGVDADGGFLFPNEFLEELV